MIVFIKSSHKKDILTGLGCDEMIYFQQISADIGNPNVLHIDDLEKDD